MPNQDPTQNPQPINDPPVQEPVVPPSFSPQSDLPPMPPAFQNIPEEKPAPVGPVETQVATEPSTGLPKVEETGSAAPPDIDISSVIKSPKKKYGTGKIIATILGLFLLVGGVGAGIILTQQQQLFKQKASTFNCGFNSDGTTNDFFCTTNCAVAHSQSGNCNNGYCCDLEATSTTPAITPPPEESDGSCAGNGFSCQTAGSDGHCPDGSVYDREGDCIASGTVCCAASTPAATPKGSWGIGKSCSNLPGTTGNKCILVTCPNGCITGCGETDPGATFITGDCEDFANRVVNICGQVDLINENGQYCQTLDYTNAQINCPQPKCQIINTSNPTPTPTPTGAAPYCAAVKAYSGANYVLLTDESISMIQPGDILHFCVAGSASSGTFDKAQFTINGATLAETTATRPGSTDFCQSYTVLSTDGTMNVSARIHHSVLGWF